MVAGADVRVLATDGTLLRQLTLDPNRSYQPLEGRWPVHNVLRQVSTMSCDMTLGGGRGIRTPGGGAATTVFKTAVTLADPHMSSIGAAVYEEPWRQHGCPLPAIRYSNRS